MESARIIREVYDAFGQGDMARLFDHMDSKIEWYPAEGHPLAPEGRPWIGKESLARDFFQAIGSEWKSFGCSPQTYHQAGENTVIVEGRYWGTHASGRELDAQFCHVWSLEGGKVLRFRQYTDTAQLHAVMRERKNP